MGKSGSFGDYSGIFIAPEGGNSNKKEEKDSFSKSTQTKMNIPNFWKASPNDIWRDGRIFHKTQSEDNILIRPREIITPSRMLRQESNSSRKLVILHKTMHYCVKKRQWFRNKQNYKKQPKKTGYGFLAKIKQCSVFIAKWSIRMIQILMHLGTAAKRSVSNLYKMFDDRHHPPCKCAECQEKIDDLTLQIRRLEESLENMMKNEGKSYEKFEYFKREVEILKYRINSGTTSNPTTSNPSLPPLPPPLPPPQTVANCSTTSVTEKKKSKENDPRPVIRLEDILKVKLKKISVPNSH